MRKWFATAAVVAVSLASVRADVTVTHSMKMEGAAAAAIGAGQMPRITTRIKGQKSRNEFEAGGQTVTSIGDLVAGQVIMLNAQARTAVVTTPASVGAGGPPVAVPELEMSFKPTGKRQVIDGQACEEYSMVMNMAMADFAGQGQLPPEAAEMMKGVRLGMNGSTWIAREVPGAGEFAAYFKAARDSKVLAAVIGMPGKAGGMERMMEAVASAPGVPYLTELTVVFEGTGPIVDAMKQMGPMKIIQKLESITTDPLADDLFKVPEGYTIEKK
jgi:hypothetical protein